MSSPAIPQQLKELMPFNSRYISVAGHQMHFIDEGEGPVVILLHGNPTWSFYYRNLIKKLGDSFRVIAVDFIGCGLSDHPADAHFRADDRISHLEEFVDALEIKKFSLVMHDWGGSIGTGLAVRRPQAVEKLVYLNTTLTETELLPSVIKLAATPIIGKFLTKTTKRFLKLTTGLGVVKRLSKEVKEGYYYPYRTAKQRTAIWDFVADIPFDSSHPSYSAMLELASKVPNLSHVPVQIVWGLKDICFHREMLNKVARHFPQAGILEIADASHLVLEDAPQRAGDAIDRFLAEGTLTESHEYRVPDEEERKKQGVLFSEFVRQASAAPFQDAITKAVFIGDDVHYSHINYGDLESLVYKYQRGLVELGLQHGDRALMLVTPGIDFLALSYAVMGCGAVPVFVDPGMGKDNLFKCIKSLKPDAFIGSPRAQLLRLARKKLFPDLKFHLTASDWIFTGGPNLNFLKKFASKPLPPVESTGVELIAYTSGATGTPKGVVYNRKMVQSQLKILREDFGMDAGKKDLPLLPIFSIFHLANGICSIFPPVDPSRPLALDPRRVLKIIRDLGVNYSFGSPTLWNKIAEYALRTREEIPSMEKIFIAGAPVPLRTLEFVKQLIPQGEAYTPYGATEALPVTLISSTEIMGREFERAVSGEQGTFVGKTIPSVEIKVIKQTDENIEDISGIEELSAYCIGEVIVKGSNISREYFERPKATARAKIIDGKGFWHRMGDYGYLDSGGNLYFCGRVAHSVKRSGTEYFSVPVEGVFNQHKKVRRSALVDLGEEEGAAVVIEPYPEHMPQDAKARGIFVQELRSLAKSDPVTESINSFYFHPSFPVDARHNAKIFRDRLSLWVKESLEVERAA